MSEDMIIWASDIDGKKVAIPINKIECFRSINGYHTQTIIYLSCGMKVEVQENIVPLTDQYNKLTKLKES